MEGGLEMLASDGQDLHNINDQRLSVRGRAVEGGRWREYWPWGRAGAGAPNPPAIRRRKLSLILRQTANIQSYNETDVDIDGIKPRGSTKTSSDGAPVQRFQSKILPQRFPEETTSESAGLVFRQTGFGCSPSSVAKTARARTEEERERFPPLVPHPPRPHNLQQPRTIRVDPTIRYQFKPEVRRSIDNHWRYIMPTEHKIAYKLQLDRLVEEKNRRLAQEMKNDAHQEQQRQRLDAPWGKAGPGGQQWRSPRQVGLNFLHSLGWTSEKALRRLENQLDREPPEHLMLEAQPFKREYHSPEDQLTGGVELVPLLARRRSFKKHMQLPSTDVTKMSKGDGEKNVSWKDQRDPQDYLRDLNCQVNQKQILIQEAKKEELIECKRHFETWGGLWGRPGHGAPKQVKVKENLQQMLYQQPVK